jgi:hypothetical protein
MNTSREKFLDKTLYRLRIEEGNVLIIAFIFLVILTLIGIFATRTAQMDMQIASNEIPYKRNFYIAEGGLYREAAELGRGNYPVINIDQPTGAFADPPSTSHLATHTSAGLPAPTPHVVFGQAYDFTVDYVGFFPPPPGYSALHFTRYDYNVDTTANLVGVESRLYKIGPKAE